MRRRRGGERGQAASEYVALLALVAVVFLALAGLTSGGIASNVLRGLQRGICAVAPGPCPLPVAPRADLAPCPLERREREERLSETIAVVELGTSGTLSAVRDSSGRVTVTLADGSSAGVAVGLGARVAFGRELGGGWTAGATATWSSGRSWRFPGAAAAERFVKRYGSKATIGGKLVDQVRSRCAILCDALGWEPHPELPPPDELLEEGGAAAELTARFGLAGRSSTAGAEAAAVLGRRIRRDGETTWYLRLSAAASARLRLPASALAARGGGGAVLSYTLDRDGRPRTLGLHLAGAAAGTASLAGEGRSGGGTARGASGRGTTGGADAAGGHGADGEGRASLVELDASLDLTVPDNRAAAAELLDALTSDLAAAPALAAALSARIARRGQIDLRRYALRSDATQLGGELSLGISLGGSFERTSKGLRLVDARTRLPGLPFLARDDCRPA